MTLVSSIITDAYRENNLIPLISTPSAAQVTEALRRLNAILLSTVGNEAGDGLNEFNIEGSNSDESLVNDWIPDNARLMFNNTSAKAYDLDPYPKEGQRFAIVDVLGNLATYNVVISGNGRRIEDAATLTLSTNSLYRQWMYRSDIGNWVRIAAVEEDDEMPFPQEFDDYFITMLAIRLAPKYGQILPNETSQALARARRQLTARYSFSQQRESDLSGRGLIADRQYFDGWNSADFDTGRIFRW